ncbi:MAG TPA: hypothetical protein ENK19_07775 [Acidobacteria bacterium]|nr:hypothetical protein [Acidobacteriota bacterium]
MATVERSLESEGSLTTDGLPQLVWDRTVIASGIRVPGASRSTFSEELGCDTSSHHVCQELIEATHWHRPDVPRLDRLTSQTALDWGRRAAAAAPHLGAERWEVILGAHLLVVPTDLVLWVLTSVHIPHVLLRNSLLQELPRRLGSILAMRAALPSTLQRLFLPGAPTAAGACLHMAHRTLPGAHLWLDPLAGDDEKLLDYASPRELAAAGAAIEAETGADHTPAPGDRVG